jgi:hypothetical protein
LGLSSAEANDNTHFCPFLLLNITALESENRTTSEESWKAT